MCDSKDFYYRHSAKITNEEKTAAKTNHAVKIKTKETIFWTRIRSERGQRDQSSNLWNNGGCK